MTVLIQHDDHQNCCSLILETSISQYLELINSAYANKGGLQQQRPPLKTASARDIRKRMVSDICEGAILPPVVIGVIVEDGISGNTYLKDPTAESIMKYVTSLDRESITIIDGMQRTTAILEAVDMKDSILSSSVRVEFWFADSVSPLIYRMLILNTGQIPWDITRQLDTIYSPLLKELKGSVENMDVFTKDDNSRRSNPGQYQSSQIIELYMIFSSREVDVDIKNKLQSDFSRLNVIEASEHSEFIHSFKRVLKLLVDFDRIFSHVTSQIAEKYFISQEQLISGWKVKSGQDIFKSAPARAGFIGATAEYIFDEAGFDVNWEDVPSKVNELEHSLNKLLNKLNNLGEEELTIFLSLDILNEKLAVKSGKIGEYERSLYLASFRSLIRNSNRLPNLRPCWTKR